MAGARPDHVAHPVLDRASAGPVVQEGHVLLPRQTDHHPQAVGGGAVEHPPGRDDVGPDRVHPVRGDRGEVRLDHLRQGELAALVARPEGSVGHAPGIELVLPVEEELPRTERRGRRSSPDRGRGGDDPNIPMTARPPRASATPRRRRTIRRNPQPHASPLDRPGGPHRNGTGGASMPGGRMARPDPRRRANGSAGHGLHADEAPVGGDAGRWPSAGGSWGSETAAAPPTPRGGHAAVRQVRFFTRFSIGMLGNWSERTRPSSSST